MVMINCEECGYPKPADADCPNPGCRPGLREYQQRLTDWYAARDAWVAEQVRSVRGYANPQAFREAYERKHPQPVPPP